MSNKNTRYTISRDRMADLRVRITTLLSTNILTTILVGWFRQVS